MIRPNTPPVEPTTEVLLGTEREARHMKRVGLSSDPDGRAEVVKDTDRLELRGVPSKDAT